jgi:hypothetical protein
MPYRTTPPPRRASQAELTAWAVRESAAWPAETPQGESYTWWLRQMEQSAGAQQPTKVKRPKDRRQTSEDSAPESQVRALTQMELF